MPPKRKASAGPAAKTGAGNGKGGSRRSKLARENGITASQEAEIREAFGLFAEPLEDGDGGGSGGGGGDDTAMVLPIGDLRRALVALGIPPAGPTELAEFVSILDPDSEGFAAYEGFVAICALKMHARADAVGTEEHAQEVDEAFRLFVSTVPAVAALNKAAGGGGAGGAGENRISLAHLKRVAATLKEDVPDEVLRDMILEANGGGSVTQGVDQEAFESVMRRAGVWK